MGAGCDGFRPNILKFSFSKKGGTIAIFSVRDFNLGSKRCPPFQNRGKGEKVEKVFLLRGSFPLMNSGSCEKFVLNHFRSDSVLNRLRSTLIPKPISEKFKSRPIDFMIGRSRPFSIRFGAIPCEGIRHTRVSHPRKISKHLRAQFGGGDT